MSFKFNSTGSGTVVKVGVGEADGDGVDVGVMVEVVLGVGVMVLVGVGVWVTMVFGFEEDVGVGVTDGVGVGVGDGDGFDSGRTIGGSISLPPSPTSHKHQVFVTRSPFCSKTQFNFDGFNDLQVTSRSGGKTYRESVIIRGSPQTDGCEVKVTNLIELSSLTPHFL